MVVVGGCRSDEPSPTVSRSGDEAGPPTPSPLAVVPTAPPPVEAVERSPGPHPPLGIGACADIEGLRAGEVLPPGTLAPVPCEAPHRVEVYATFTHPAGAAIGYPQALQMNAFADDRCLAAFAGFVGTPYDRSAFDQTTVQPTEATWTAGDRAVSCVLYDGDFAVLTGSARASAR